MTEDENPQALQQFNELLRLRAEVARLEGLLGGGARTVDLNKRGASPDYPDAAERLTNDVLFAREHGVTVCFGVVVADLAALLDYAERAGAELASFRKFYGVKPIESFCLTGDSNHSLTTINRLDPAPDREG